MDFLGIRQSSRKSGKVSNNNLLLRVFIILSACLLISSQAPAGAWSQATVQIEIHDGLVSMQSRDADLLDLLREITTRSGIGLWIADGVLPKPTTVNFDGLPLERVLDRLLSGTSHAIVFDEVDGETRIKKIFVLPPGSSTSAAIYLEPAAGVTEPGAGNAHSSVPENRTELLGAVFDSELIPDNIKAAILSMADNQNREPVDSNMPSRSETLLRLSEVLDKVGSASPQTMQLLREHYQPPQMQQ